MPSSAHSLNGHTGNMLLDALPKLDRERLLVRAHREQLALRDIVHQPGRRITKVYFPASGVISLVGLMENGATIEMATVGREGMVGLTALLGGTMIGNGRAVSQVPGEAIVVRADTVRTESNRPGRLRDLLLGYSQALVAQISQAVACNALHQLQERCARWLLETHDRAGDNSNEFLLTQEYLSDMLGVRRASVTVAAGILQKAGYITYRRGRITVLDRAGLEGASCECYAAIRAEYDRVVPL